MGVVYFPFLPSHIGEGLYPMEQEIPAPLLQILPVQGGLLRIQQGLAVGLGKAQLLPSGGLQITDHNTLVIGKTCIEVALIVIVLGRQKEEGDPGKLPPGDLLLIVLLQLLGHNAQRNGLRHTLRGPGGGVSGGRLLGQGGQGLEKTGRRQEDGQVLLPPLQ